MTRAALFLHGFLTDDNDFGCLYDVVGEYYDEIIRHVHPGHKKPNNFNEFQVTNTVNECLNEFDKLQAKYDEVDVYGFSMGGALATHISKLRNPARLILLAPANKYLNYKVVFSQFRYQLKNVGSIILSESEERFNAAKRAFSTFYQNDKIGWGIALKQLIPNYNVHTLSTFAKIVNVCNEGLTEITCPTLILWGHLDQFVPIESIEYLRPMLKNPQSTVRIYDDMSHLMLYSENDREVIDEIVGFIK